MPLIDYKQILNGYNDNRKVIALFKEEIFSVRRQTGRQRAVTDRWGWEKDKGFQVKNPRTGNGQSVSAVQSNLTGMTILLIEDSSVIMQKMSGFSILTCSVLLLFAGSKLRVCEPFMSAEIFAEVIYPILGKMA